MSDIGATATGQSVGYQTAWLTERILLAAGELPLPRSPAGQIELQLMPDLEPEAHWLPFGQGARKLKASNSRGLLLVRFREPVRGRSLAVVGPSRFPLVESGEAADPLTDLWSLGEQLAALDRTTNDAVQHFVLATTSNGDKAERALAESLHQIREVLRERLPESPVDRDSSLCLQVDALYRIDSRSLYLDGWSRSDRRLTELILLAPEGWAVDLTERAYRYCRPDVADFFGEVSARSTNDYGFVAYFELPTATVLPEGWVLLARDTSGAGVEVAVPAVTSDERLIRESIIGDIALERLPEDRLRRQHLLPAVARMQRRLAERTSIQHLDQFGEPPDNPIASVVVPLYKRVDFLEQQLSQFVLDPELLETDLIYVLDSPEDGDYLRTLAMHLYRLYGVPFRLATLTRNGGFSLANNLGASLARASLLLMLNSDIFPERPGWLGQLVSFYESTPGIGALSPKLLYEDDSIQFAGLYFDRPEGAHVWANEHYYKGLHRDLPEANVARPVPSVTGACLLISTELFRALGGLRGAFVQGDYEDSDLCIRLAEAGYDSWYLPEVALYHLEGQSYPSELRKATSEFNKWLHTHLWRDRLDASDLIERDRN